MSGFPPTEEQSAICAASGRVVKVNAFAGTGKSSTLAFLADSRPQERMLYVAFNRAIKEEAERRFPQNVVTKTGHGLAYAAKGHPFGSVPRKLQGDIKPFHISQRLLSSGLGRSVPQTMQTLFAGRVIETLKNYLVSADIELGLGHASVGCSPSEQRAYDGSMLVAAAKQVWSWMQTPSDPVPMLHDGYLKLFQISKPRLNASTILFDEAQDTNPVMQAIITDQPCRVVYVGDRHQAIYGFRGAANAMEIIHSDDSFGLTGSFRFGPQVADVANRLLKLKQEKLVLRGLGENTVVAGVDSKGSNAFISRGNSALFHEAVRAMSAERPFAFVGDIRGYKFDLIVDAWNLYCGDDVKDPFTASFSSFDQFAEYGEEMDDREIKSRVKLIGHYDHQIPELVEKIHQRALPFIKDASPPVIPIQVLTTAHKSKGLEFDAVRIAGDFPSLFDEDGGVFDIADASQSDIEEVNLQYVAVTRARKRLMLSEDLEMFMDWSRSLDDDEQDKPSIAPTR